MMNCGLYEIASPSGKRYVGSAKNIRRRWVRHIYRLRKGTHVNGILQAAWDKYGETRMTFRVVLSCRDADLFFYEQIAIDSLRPEYNIATVVGLPSSRKGIAPSPETRELLSKALRGKALSEEHRRAISLGQTGTKASDAARKNMSAAQRGRGKSREHRQRLSDSLRGRKLNPEHAAKAAVAMLGKKHSPETIAKMSATKRRNDAAKREDPK